jgi:Ca-activated chloride channel homolog
MNRLVVSFLLSLTAPAAAQGLLIGPADGGSDATSATTSQPRRPGVHIVGTKIHADIVDGVATTTIDQTIRNTTQRIAEGTWFLPLPAGAVADGFTMTVGGKEISGEVLDAGQARSVYESIVRRRRDPGLLEYAGEGMLRARIFPIPANGEIGVTVRLRQVLQPTGGMYEWSFPLRVAKLGDAAAGPVGLEVRIQSRAALSSVVTPHADAEIRRQGEHKASVSLEGTKGDLEDLRVLYGLTEQEFGMHLLPFRTGQDAGYFTMLLSPPRTLSEAKVPARLVQMVVDTSGSMKGDKIKQAKASLRTFLQSLRPIDYFQVVTFASSVDRFFAQPRKATKENVDAALARVETLRALGGTNIGDALREALEAATPGEGFLVPLTQIVFITDGQPTVGLTNPSQILELTKQTDQARTRIFALGVGDQIDVRLLDDLVAQHHGARDFVGSKEKIEAKVDALCQKISLPALTDVVVKCEGLDSFHVHPAKTQDLFCGEMMQVVGRYRDHGSRVVTVTGKQNGVQKEYRFTVEFPKAALKHSFVQTLWARQHVAGLLNNIRRNGQKAELMEEVRRLATRYGIVTPYTSHLIVEEGMRLAGQPTQPGGGHHRGVPSRPEGPATTSAGPRGHHRGAGLVRKPAPTGQSLEALGKARTGQAAVAESKALVITGSSDFYLGARESSAEEMGDRQANKEKLLYRAAGRIFVRAGLDLVEQGLPTDWQKQAFHVSAFSKEYFALLKQRPEVASILALGERVVFRDGERIVHVKIAAKEPAPKKPSKPTKLVR